MDLPTDIEERLWSKVDKTASCWLWRGGVNNKGYGTIAWRVKGKLQTMYAHRLSYLLAYGELPDALQTCHSCDVRTCVRPDHLFMGTSHDNHVDMLRKGRQIKIVSIFGERHPNASITDEQAQEIRVKRHNGAIIENLMVEYGMSRSTINRLIKGDSWKHLGEPLPPPSLVPKKAYCKKGHRMEGDNLVFYKADTRSGYAACCRTCKQETGRRAYDRRKAKQNGD